MYLCFIIVCKLCTTHVTVIKFIINLYTNTHATYLIYNFSRKELVGKYLQAHYWLLGSLFD